MPTEAVLAWFRELRGIRLGPGEPEFSPESLETLLDSLPIAVSMTAGAEHRFVYANRLYRQILLPHAGDPVGRTVAEVFGALYSAEFAAARDRIIEAGEANARREVPIRLGEAAPPMYWDVSQVPLLGQDGAAQGVLTLVGTEAPIDRQDRRKRLIDGMRDGSSLMFVAEAEGKIIGGAGLHRVTNGLYGIGMLILLGSSTMLVTSHWRDYTPLWKYLVLIGYTAAIHFCGQFAYHRLALRRTGTGLMALTVLLIPDRPLPSRAIANAHGLNAAVVPAADGFVAIISASSRSIARAESLLISS